jgi:hypothetical protein
MRAEDALQVDFMATIHGIRSYEGLRSRTTAIAIGGATLGVAREAHQLPQKAGRAARQRVVTPSRRLCQAGCVNGGPVRAARLSTAAERSIVIDV